MYSVPDVSGKIFIITGSNSGLGKECAQRLTHAGAHVVMAVRDIDKGHNALRDITRHVPSASIDIEQLDLSSLDSIQNFVQRIVHKYPVIDVLMNNAGVMTPPQRFETCDGFELQFGTNYLGHFALTYRLLPHILNASQPRVVTLSSLAALFGKVRLDDLNYLKRRYIAYLAYGQSKLADSLLAAQLAQLADKHGWNLISVAAHPGFTHTNLQTSGSSLGGKTTLVGLLNKYGVKAYSQKVDMGAGPSLYAATAPQVENNDYYGPDGVFQLKGEVKKIKLPAKARDKSFAHSLYHESLQLAGIDESHFV